MSCTNTCTSTSAVLDCDTKTYTDGYTTGKRNAHIATVSIIFAFGAALMLIGWIYRNNTIILYRTVMAGGGILALTMALALIPILKQPVVAGRTVKVVS